MKPQARGEARAKSMCTGLRGKAFWRHLCISQHTRPAPPHRCVIMGEALLWKLLFLSSELLEKQQRLYCPSICLRTGPGHVFLCPHSSQFLEGHSEAAPSCFQRPTWVQIPPFSPSFCCSTSPPHPPHLPNYIQQSLLHLFLPSNSSFPPLPWSPCLYLCLIL